MRILYRLVIPLSLSLGIFQSLPSQKESSVSLILIRSNLGYIFEATTPVFDRIKHGETEVFPFAATDGKVIVLTETSNGKNVYKIRFVPNRNSGAIRYEDTKGKKRFYLRYLVSESVDVISEKKHVRLGTGDFRLLFRDHFDPSAQE